MNVETGVRRAAMVAALLPAALSGCYHPKVINDADARYCETLGLPRGSNANADCATKRESDRIEAGQAPAPEEHAPSTPMPAVSPPPPAHHGGVAQTTPVNVMPDTTMTVDFFVSVNPDCGVDGLPTVRIDAKPANGIVRLVQRADYARFSQSNLPAACGGKKIPGIAVEYTPNKDYAGTDSMEFQLITKNGSNTVFKIPITVVKPSQDDDD